MDCEKCSKIAKYIFTNPDEKTVRLCRHCADYKEVEFIHEDYLENPKIQYVVIFVKVI